jgi:hypothetical protein
MSRRLILSSLFIVFGASAIAAEIASQKPRPEEPGDRLVLGQSYLFAFANGSEITGQVMAKPANGWVRVKILDSGPSNGTPGCCGVANPAAGTRLAAGAPDAQAAQPEPPVKEAWVNLAQVAVIATIDPAARPKPACGVPCI